MTNSAGSTFLAFDFGSQSIGAAAASRVGGLSTPLSAVRVFRSGPDWNGIDRLVKQWQPAGLVVGLAFNASGGHTAFSRQAKRFGEQLGRRYNLPVHWVDERLSTEAARTALRQAGGTRKPRKDEIDCTAAALILDAFLEQHQ